MAENRIIIAVHKSREVLLDILTERGFVTDEYKGFSVSEIHNLVQNSQLDMLVENTEGDKKLYIKYYNLDKTLRPANVHEIVESLFTVEQILSAKDDLIIIVKDEPNDTLQKLLRTYYTHDGIFITLINIDRLQFNILNHSLVPKHKLLTAEATQKIRKQYHIISDKNFPTISRFDPVALVLGIRPGELFEITRSSKTAISSKFYRICSQ
jgi:DNA-directed RNA polymerase subunit H (RpoH/RPB5)